MIENMSEYELKPCPYMEIQLTRGKVAKVSPEDYDELSKFKWHATTTHNGNYAARCVRKSDTKRAVNVYMHRQILKACDSNEFEVDHINGDPLDNRRENLRLVEHHQNAKNQTCQDNVSSKFKGVYWSTNDNSWVVQIKENGRYRTIHGIQSEDIAGMIYDLLALDRFKEYARFNNPKFIEALNTRYEPDELPEWVKKEIKGRLYENVTIMDATHPRIQVDIAALNWVLSLRKPEETECKI